MPYRAFVCGHSAQLLRPILVYKVAACGHGIVRNLLRPGHQWRNRLPTVRRTIGLSLPAHGREPAGLTKFILDPVKGFQSLLRLRRPDAIKTVLGNPEFTATLDGLARKASRSPPQPHSASRALRCGRNSRLRRLLQSLQPLNGQTLRNSRRRIGELLRMRWSACVQPGR